MTPKQAEQFNTMRAALLEISKRYLTPSQLRRNQYGLSYEEALEGAYENIRSTAAAAVRGVRGITVATSGANCTGIEQENRSEAGVEVETNEGAKS